MNELFMKVCVILFCLSTFVCLINILIIFSGLYFYIEQKNKKIIIRLPKSKKWKNKVDPIYDIYKYQCDNLFSVRKWKLEYESHSLFNFIAFFIIPYPIQIMKYGYVLDDYSYYIEGKNQLEQMKVSLKEFYELRDLKEREKKDKANLESNRLKNILDSLNKEYIENYE